MSRETEFVLAREIRDGTMGHPQDELPHRGKVLAVMNDSGILTIRCENGSVIKDMNAPIERYERVGTHVDDKPGTPMEEYTGPTFRELDD